MNIHISLNGACQGTSARLADGHVISVHVERLCPLRPPDQVACDGPCRPCGCRGIRGRHRIGCSKAGGSVTRTAVVFRQDRPGDLLPKIQELEISAPIEQEGGQDAAGEAEGAERPPDPPRPVYRAPAPPEKAPTALVAVKCRCGNRQLVIKRDIPVTRCKACGSGDIVEMRI